MEMNTFEGECEEQTKWNIDYYSIVKREKTRRETARMRDSEYAWVCMSTTPHTHTTKKTES